MLDNFTPKQLKADAKVFKAKFPHVIVEASGGITKDTIADFLRFVCMQLQTCGRVADPCLSPRLKVADA